MDRRRGREVLLALLAVGAVALVAVAAAPMFEQERGAERSPELTQPTPNGSAGPNEMDSPVPLETLLGGIFLVAAIGFVVQFAADPWEMLKQVVGVIALVGLAVAIGRYLLTLDPPSADSPPAGQPNGTPTPAPNGTAGFGEGSTDPYALPADSIAMIVLVAGAVGVVALFAFRSDAVRSTIGLAAPSDDADDGLTEVGRVAGDAADRVESASSPEAADNAIYDAWRELVDLLDAPDPQSGTPRQFAAAALEAGMDRDDVALLTRAFEDVRYGGAELSPERREDATAALRRIEATHGEGAEPPPSPPSGSVAALDLDVDPDGEPGGTE